MSANYRVLVRFDAERNVFIARAPELGDHSIGEGATRAEALGKLEEEMNAQLENMKEQGKAPPPVDDDKGAFNGELNLKVSHGLHRDLAWQARIEGVELGQLVGELLAGAIELRRQQRRRPNPNQRDDAQPPQREQQPQQGGRDRDRRGGGQGGGRYHAIMEDRATFLEYVRGLEQGQQQGGGARRGPRDRRGPGGQGGQGGPGRQGGQGGQPGQTGKPSDSDDEQ